MKIIEQPVGICGSSTVVENQEKCPICGGLGQKVKKITVENIVKAECVDKVTEENYLLCLTPECEVIYFNQSGDIYFTDKEVKVPIWFKKNATPAPICYCKNVTDKDIIRHIAIDKCCNSLEDIKLHTGANTGCECLTKNPAGK